MPLYISQIGQLKLGTISQGLSARRATTSRLDRPGWDEQRRDHHQK
jgi:hypothetical protein